MTVSKKPLASLLLGSATLMLVATGAADQIEATFEHMAADPNMEMLLERAADASSDFWPTNADDPMNRYRPYSVVDGILRIPVQGVLLHKFPYSVGRWATGYQYIEKALERGLADPEVKGIAFLSDSPGGMVAGCFECAEKIFNARGQKPIRAIAADSAYSAAYMTVSATDSVTVTKSGGVGSIGVVLAHVEYSKKLEKEGITVTLLHEGKHKVDGNPYEALSETAKARMQGRLKKMYAQFTSSVARNRNLDESKVKGTEALTYDAEEGIEIGLADKIGALEEELALFANDMAETGAENMSVQPNVTGKKPGTENENPGASFSKEDVDAADSAGHARGVTEGVNSERARISGILALEEAKTRPVATNFMIDMGLSVDVAKEKLAAFPPEKQGADSTQGSGDRNHFEEMMNKTGNPNITAGGDGSNENASDDDDKTAKMILGDFRSATGQKIAS